MRPLTGSGVYGLRAGGYYILGGEPFYMPIATEGSGMPTLRPLTGSGVYGLRAGGYYTLLGGEIILHAHNQCRFRHAHHETGNWSKVLGQEDITHRHLFKCYK